MTWVMDLQDLFGVAVIHPALRQLCIPGDDGR
jgi:hypothetical protein